jgi:hypothetical protein
MIETFKQYYSINEPLQRAPDNFSQLKNGLRSIAKNLVKEELPQGKLILQFVDSVSKNFETLKQHTQTLQDFQRISGDKFFDENYLPFLKQMSSFTASYKSNIRELVEKFARIQA